MLPILAVIAVASAQGGPPPPVFDADEEEKPLPSAFAHDADGWGVGVLLGLPTGLSAAHRPGGRVFYDLALAWSFDRGTLAAHGDVLVTLADLRTEELEDLVFPVWVGLGPRLRLGDAPETPGDDLLTLGARASLGMSVVHAGVPLEGFLEICPGVGLYPSTAPTFDIAIGGRYYFGRGAAKRGGATEPVVP